jgi:lactoylglutathione lyase
VNPSLEMSMKSEFAYVGIRVTNLEKSVDFYTKLLGMKVTGRGRIEKTRGETVGLQSEQGGFTLELNHYAPDSPHSTEYTPGEGLDHLAFKVENLDEALKEAREAGHKTILEINTNGSRWAYIQDPDGLWIELF